MMYGFSCPTDSTLSNTVFTNYKIINKSSGTLNSVYIGNWSDLEIGAANDDYTGCDVTRGAYYGYNADSFDFVYGSNPPVQAVVFLNGPYADANGIDDSSSASVNGTGYGDGISDNERLGMSKYISYSNDNSVQGNPASALNNYQYISGSWKDATPWTYGGNGHLTGVNCDYIYPGASDSLGYGTGMIAQPAWDEMTAGSVPANRRGMGSFGPFTLQPGIIHEIDFAYVFAHAASEGNSASLNLMRDRIDCIRFKFYTQNLNCGCSEYTAVSEEAAINNLSLYPNPTTDLLNIEYTSAAKNYLIRIFDSTGRLMYVTQGTSGKKTLSLSGLTPGIYVVNILDNDNNLIKRFIKQ